MVIDFHAWTITGQEPNFTKFLRSSARLKLKAGELFLRRPAVPLSSGERGRGEGELFPN
jgi:hypothetical protein